MSTLPLETELHSYQPSQGHGLPHDPFNAIVGPRPIGWISTLGPSGAPNLAPYSFFNAFNYIPPIIGFSSTGYKDTVANIEATGEFVWNLCTRPLAEAMNASCEHFAPEVSEFERAGLTPLPSTQVAPPRVGESPVAFECKLSHFMQLKSAAGEPIDTWFVMGEVVAVHIAQRLLKDGIYDTANAGHIVRGGGPKDYFSIGPEQLFHMRRPEGERPFTPRTRP
jgi:flavin reductase (DIM6/NTAB) family NADH-FMN oxidoreductase RutF